MAGEVGQKFENLVELYQRAFGRVGLPFPAAKLSLPSNPLGTLEAIGKQFDKRPATQPPPTYGSFKTDSILGSSYFMPTKLDGFQLWNEPLVSVSGRKNVISTPVAGSTRRGSVHEIISTEDYEVRIRGFIVNDSDPDTYPEAGVRKFRQLFETNTALAIDCLLCHLFGISQVVITGFDFPEVEGFPGMQPYNISGLSDEPFEFELKTPLSQL